MSGSIQSTSSRSGRRSASCTRALVAVLGLPHLEAGAPQRERDHLADRAFILDDQYLSQLAALPHGSVRVRLQIS